MTMQPSYAELAAQIETLKIAAQEAKKREASDVIAEMKAKIELFGLTQKDLFGTQEKTKKAISPKVAVTKGVTYRHPDGRTWSGHGRRPQWIIDAAPSGIAQYEVQPT